MKKITCFFLILLFIQQSSNAQWTLAGTAFSGIVRGLFFNNVDTGYAVGSGGVLSKTTDGGITWTPQSSGVVTDLRSVFFVDDNLGYITGASGIVLKTTDGGANWVLSNTGISVVTLRAVDFTSADTGLVGSSAGVIYQTTDGGIKWNTISLGITSDIIQLDMYDANVGYAVASDASFLNGYVLKTTDGGNTWTQVYSDPAIGLLGLAVGDQNTVYAGGEAQTIIKTTDGGTTWSTVHTGTVTQRIRSGFALSPTEAYLVDDFSNIFSTNDGGTTWQDTVLTGGLYSIYFVNSVGYTGNGIGSVYKIALCIPGEPVTYYADKDGDSYGDPLDTIVDASCKPPLGYVTSSTDCDDLNAAINPGAQEILNGIDDDCDGQVDECYAPSALSTIDITSTSATLTWDEVPVATKYKVRYRKGSGAVTSFELNAPASSLTISGLLPSSNYYWQIRVRCGIEDYTSWSPWQPFTTPPYRISGESLEQASFQIYPNPAEDHATIQFTLPQSSHMYIKVYEVSGKEIATLLDGEMEQGVHSLQLNTIQFSKGVYMLKMISDFGTVNQKLIVQ